MDHGNSIRTEKLQIPLLLTWIWKLLVLISWANRNFYKIKCYIKCFVTNAFYGLISKVLCRNRKARSWEVNRDSEGNFTAIALNLRRPGRSNRASHARFYPSAHNFITRIEEEERVGFFGGRRISNNFITISMASQWVRLFPIYYTR